MSLNSYIDNIISTLEIMFIDLGKSIRDSNGALVSKFDNHKYIDSIDNVRYLNNNQNINVVVVALDDQSFVNNFTETLKELKEISFIVISETLNKEFTNLSNVINITNIKRLENTIAKTLKDRYKNAELYLNFEDGRSYNLKTKKLFIEKEEVKLTPREQEFLDLLIENVNNILDHKTIQDKIWHESYDVNESAYKSLLNKLRNKVGKKTVKNISGKGYTINFQ